MEEFVDVAISVGMIECIKWLVVFEVVNYDDFFFFKQETAYEMIW